MSAELEARKRFIRRLKRLRRNSLQTLPQSTAFTLRVESANLWTSLFLPRIKIKQECDNPEYQTFHEDEKARNENSIFRMGV